MKTTILPLRNLVNCSPSSAFLLIPFVVACFALSSRVQAVVPAPDGGYPGGNTAEGTDALFNLTEGIVNTAIGINALYSNTTGSYNTAVGSSALYSNTTGSYNTANGFSAMQNSITGNSNTATGLQALFDNTTGNNNTANGLAALFVNSTGSNNTANGKQALFRNSTRSNNRADGSNALNHNTVGNNNIALGYGAGGHLDTGDNNIDIGNRGVTGEAGAIRIGTRGTHRNTSIAGISGVTVPNGVGVIIDTNGHLGTVVSSERFKDAIKPMDKASEAILALKPVTFHYKKELDPDGISQFGLVAEQVEKVNPDLVARDEQGKPYTVRYEAVNAMLLNEFLKEHRKNEEQEATIARQQKQIEVLTEGLQKVSAQIELSKFTTGRIRLGGPAPRTVGNNP